MIKVSKLIEELQKFPHDALAYAYEGEIVGVVIVSPPSADSRYGDQLGHIPATEDETEFDGPAVIE